MPVPAANGSASHANGSSSKAGGASNGALFDIPTSRPAINELTEVDPTFFKREEDGCLYASDSAVTFKGGKNGQYNLGHFLAHRIEELGVKEYFAIPGDFNLILLDQIIENKAIQMIGCCNELNMGYAADGYARQYGVAVAICTLSVGGLSMANAVAGALSEDVPMIVISGGAHTNDYVNDNLVHHSTNQKNKNQCLEMFSKITCKSVRVDQPHNAEAIITDAFETALRMKQPVYIEICHNLATAPVQVPYPMCIEPGPVFNAKSLRASAYAIIEAFDAASNPVLMFGVRALAWARQVDGIRDRLLLLERLARTVGCGHVVQPGAKGLMDEDADGYMGVYWGHVSISGCQETVENADLVLAVGTHWDDVTTCGYSMKLDTTKILSIDQKSGVRLPDGRSMACHDLSALLTELINGLKAKSQPNASSLKSYKSATAGASSPDDVNKPSTGILKRDQLMRRVSSILNSKSTIFGDAGDNWFNLIEMDLPGGARAHSQLSYASIGWSLPAVLGASFPCRRYGGRAVVLVGDGAAQMTFQEISTMIRYRANPIVILLNNYSYAIEEVLHAGPYNLIPNWHYSKMIEFFVSTTDPESGEGVISRLVHTEAELCDALQAANTGKSRDRLCFIEASIQPEDVNDLLLRFGKTAGKWNGRPTAEGLNEGFHLNNMVGL